MFEFDASAACMEKKPLISKNLGCCWQKLSTRKKLTHQEEERAGCDLITQVVVGTESVPTPVPAHQYQGMQQG